MNKTCRDVVWCRAQEYGQSDDGEIGSSVLRPDQVCQSVIRGSATIKILHGTVWEGTMVNHVHFVVGRPLINTKLIIIIITESTSHCVPPTAATTRLTQHRPKNHPCIDY
jgi:hypothetical protein